MTTTSPARPEGPGTSPLSPMPPLSLVMIDNYDSFTFNLVQYFQELGASVTTVRHDERTVADLVSSEARPDFFVLSPGPSDPDHAGICLELIAACARLDIPLLGVCLGHQAIGQAFGGQVVRLPLPMHGKVSEVWHEGAGVFEGLPRPLKATRYHSLGVEKASFPTASLAVTAWTDDGVIMGLRHRERLIEGVQFHPESVLTEQGHQLLGNFMKAVAQRLALAQGQKPGG